MHNIKDIRNNFDNFKNIIKSRNVSIDLDQIIDLDKNNRNLIQKKESLEQEKKEISKKKDKSLFAKSKEIYKPIRQIRLDNTVSNTLIIKGA
jgi:seryl-tRNA synthetase